VLPRRIAWTLALCCLLTIAASAQSSRPPLGKDPLATPAESDEARDRITRDMAKKANVERQAALKADTDKLVKLTAELKESVDKSSENVLSMEVLKKAEEIEKLAHSVKEKMKGQR
jgi:hypothetical protein